MVLTQKNLVATLVGACALAGGVTAIAVGQGEATDPASKSSDPQIARWDVKSLVAKDASPITAVPAGVTEQFAVFARPADGLPDKVAARVGARDNFGRNTALARRIETINGYGWVTPGDGWLCLTVPAPGGIEAVGCSPTETAAAKGLWVRVGTPGASQAIDTVVTPVGVKAVQFGPKQVSVSRDGVASAEVSTETDYQLVR